LSRKGNVHEKGQSPTDDANVSSAAREGESADAQEAPTLFDLQAALLFLLLMERLSGALEAPIPDVEETIVDGESVPKEEQAIEHESVRVHPFRKSKAFSLLPVLCMLCLAAVSTLVLFTRLTPTASVTIIPAQMAITSTIMLTTTTGSTNAAQLQIPGRLLPSLTLEQTRTVPTTGTGHQAASSAHGTITFYNGLPSMQTIVKGTLLTGADGVQVVTDRDAIIPAATLATPPIDGQVTVAARAVHVGPGGNIGAHDINRPCCREYILAQNTTAFTGGQDARSYPMVKLHDIDGAASSLKSFLAQSMQAALGYQLTPAEALVIPVPCVPTVTSTHRTGEEATQVTVTVDEVCTGEAYDKSALRTQIVRRLAQQAKDQLGPGYCLSGEVQATIQQVTIMNAKQGTVALKLKAMGVWVYRFSDKQVQNMAGTIVGKSKQQAANTLLRIPGVSQVAITLSGTGSVTLPADPGKIRILVLYRPV